MTYRYVGEHGSYLDGVPARDLTDEDMAALPPEKAAQVRHSPIYEAVGEKSGRKRKDEPKPAEESADDETIVVLAEDGAESAPADDEPPSPRRNRRS